MKRTVSAITLSLLILSILTLTFNIPHIKANDPWVWVRNTVTGAWGETVVGTGNAIYIARKTSFYCYDPADNSWTALAAPPNPDAGDAFKTGTALAWDFSDYIYALYGAATPDSRRWFYRYSISSDSWEALANTTADQGEGDAITWIGTDNCIYATIGGEQRPTYFVRYDPSTDSWSDAPADPPAGMGDGASLVWTGGDFLYVLRGEFDELSPLCDFWRYSLSGDAWTAMANISANAHSDGVGGVGDGGSLLYVGLWLSNYTDYIYALSGNQAYPEAIPDNRTYRYTISLNSWELLADLPFGVGYYVGCRLGYADGHIYAWQGTPSTWTGGGDDLAKYEFPATAEGTPVGGYISENTTWTLDGSPYIVVEDVIVEPDVFLTIEPGVVVKFTSGTNLLIDGGLIAQGNFTHQIIFTSNATTPAPGDWGSIRFRDKSDDIHSIIDWTVVQYANIGVSCESASPNVKNSLIEWNNVGISAYKSGLSVVNCTIISNVDRGVSGDGAWSDVSWQISSSIIASNGGDGISLYIYSDSSAHITDSNVSDNGLTGVAMHMNVLEITSIVSISNNVISNNSDGIYAYDDGGLGLLEISNNSVTSNTGRGIAVSLVWDVIGLRRTKLSNNEISNNAGTGVYVYRDSHYGSISLEGSTISHNNNSGVISNIGNVHGSRMFSNTPYDFVVTSSDDVDATQNWWGTTNETLIEEHIYDYYDDYNLGRVLYKPFLMPPVANFTYSPATPFVYQTVTFDASASFNLYGSIINYTWDFGDENTTTTTSPTTNHTYATPGTYNVTLTVTDEFGLTNSTVKSLTVLQDDVPPVTIDDYDGAWHNVDFTITLTATDFESGVAETYYRINKGPTKSISVNAQPYIAAESANNTLEYWSVDYAGNEELPHKILTGIKLDKTPPTSSINFSGAMGDNNWFISNVTITLAATDTLSGVDNIEYSLDNITWTTYIKPFTIEDEGYISIYYASKDEADNLETVKTDAVKIDKTPPCGSVLINEDVTYVNSKWVTLTVSADDTTSGVVQMRFSNDNITWTSWETYNNSKAWALTSGDETKTVYAQFMDNAGLISKIYTDSIILDTTLPIIGIPSRVPGGDIQPDQDVRVSVNVTDFVSGVKKVTLSYTIDGSPWEDRLMNFNLSTDLYEDTIPGQPAGTRVKYKIIAYDYAGNNATKDGTEPYCSYQVIPEFPTTIIGPLLIALTFLVTVLAKKTAKKTRRERLGNV